MSAADHHESPRSRRLARVDAALEARFPSTPLNIMSRRINRLAEVLPREHECEPIFGEFDALGEYVRSLEVVDDRYRMALQSARDFITGHPAVRGEWPLLVAVIDKALVKNNDGLREGSGGG